MIPSTFVVLRAAVQDTTKANTRTDVSLCIVYFLHIKLLDKIDLGVKYREKIIKTSKKCWARWAGWAGCRY